MPDLVDPNRRAAAPRWTFALVAALLLPLMVFASRDFGATWDEKSRHRYGENILEYFQGQRTRASFDVDGGSPYGGLFDVLCAAVERWVPIERYTLRHGINAVFGWIGVLFSGLLAARLFGTWTGVMAMILLASAPRYFAHSMNNPKDLPFAALSVAALYQFTRLSSAWPYFSWGTAARVALVLGLALNIRAGALLYLGYFGLLVAGCMLVEAVSARRVPWPRVGLTAARLAAVAVVTMLVGTIFWPWAQGSPLTRPVQALIGFVNYDWGGFVVFRGQTYDATNLPWYYAPEWVLISTPPVILLGAAASMALLVRRDRRLPVALLWIAAALPVVLVVARRSTLYDGIRHLLFAAPPLVILASAAWTRALQQPRTWLRATAGVVLAAGLVNVLAFDVRAHPNQIVYFNEIVGGPRGALGKYDMDYWGNCLLQAVVWTAETARTAHRPIAVSGNPLELVQLDAERFREVYFLPPNGPYEVYIRLNRGPAQAVLAFAARKDAIYRVDTPDGALLCAVLPGPRFAQLEHDLRSALRRSRTERSTREPPNDLATPR